MLLIEETKVGYMKTLLSLNFSLGLKKEHSLKKKKEADGGTQPYFGYEKACHHKEAFELR